MKVWIKTKDRDRREVYPDVSSVVPPSKQFHYWAIYPILSSGDESVEFFNSHEVEHLIIEGNNPIEDGEIDGPIS